MKQRSSESINDFKKIESMLSCPSSHRTPSIRDCTNIQEGQTNFHQEEMKNIREKIFLKKVIKQLQSLISRNKVHEDMYQQWQANQQNQEVKSTFEQQPLDEKIAKLYPRFTTFSILQGLTLILFLWCLSVAIVFQQKLFSPVFLIVMAVQLVILILKGLVINLDGRLAISDTLSKLKKFYTLIIVLMSSFLMVVRNEIQIKQLAICIDCSMIIVFCIVSQKVSSNFKAIKMYAQSRKMIKQLRIIELFVIVLAISHIFALIIYSSIYLQAQGERSWLSGNGKDLETKAWGTKYIYAVYWSITTIVTVGYGDLTPQNQKEVIVIMILQIFGTSFFGYMINVIGITVDNINKKNQEYDNYQETISKLKDHYQLSDELCYDMKKDIEKKYTQSNGVVSLRKNEEMDFLQYVDSTVKRNFILQTNIRIIKKSIFFLTYFTVNFQNYVALKLIRIIYKKDQNIQTYDPITKQRNIIIVNHGKVSIFLQKRQNNVAKTKLVRTIEPIEGKPALNVIGYSSLILNQNIDLYSCASEMTSGYILRMSDVLECIDKSMIDYESFHQMRQKMLLFSMKEAIQAPSLKDSNFHYTPNIFILACKYNKNAKQSRKKKDRRNKRGFLWLDKVKTQLAKEWYTVNHDVDESFQSDDAQMNAKMGKKLDDFQSLLSVQDHQDHLPIAIIGQQQTNKSEEKYLNVDQVKIFQHFMKNHNINHVAVNYQKSCILKSYRGRVQSVNIKKMGQLGARLMKKSEQRISERKSRKIGPIRL